jgi:hypothetical protein
MLLDLLGLIFGVPAALVSIATVLSIFRGGQDGYELSHPVPRSPSQPNQPTQGQHNASHRRR